jgi:2-polyprenyl-6-methoxyphenol hydroxylase-like FAD-dependent oxidoreductase
LLWSIKLNLYNSKVILESLGLLIIIIDLKISIIGSGFAGLSSALFLCRHKLNTITLYDKFDQVQTAGAGFLIQPSSMEILRKLDLYEKLIENGDKVYYLEGINHRG